MLDTLEALGRIERQYDGPIPPQARLAARLGGAAAAHRAVAAAEARFFTTLARGQVRALRRLRALGAREDGALASLRFYLGERRRHRRLAC